MKKCLVLVNPASGDGKSMESIPKLEKRLEESFDVGKKSIAFLL